MTSKPYKSKLHNYEGVDNVKNQAILNNILTSLIIVAGNEKNSSIMVNQQAKGSYSRLLESYHSMLGHGLSNKPKTVGDSQMGIPNKPTFSSGAEGRSG